ncbi:MAG: Omp28-related outer membrane protein [Muribaculaceae bacterium]|nr:Omp28-related outer membrane protein [Muribaculaceae bacterium]
MKKAYTIIIMLLMFVGYASAQESEDVFYLGYCNGEINSLGTGKSGECVVSAAIMIPKEDLGLFVGCDINKVRVGLAYWYGDLRPESITGWIRHSLDGPNEAEGTTTELKPEAWSEIAFTDTYKITGENDIYIGYSYHQDKKLNCMSLSGTSVPNGCWIAKNDKWVDYSSNNYGNVSVEAIVTGDNLPKFNLALKSCGVAHLSVRHGENIIVNYEIENIGARPVEEFILKYEIGDNYRNEVSVKTPIAYRQHILDQIEIPTSEIAYSEKAMPIKITLLISESEDEDMTNNTAEFKVAMYETAFPRKVLLEQFTTELCTFCPAAGERIATALDGENYSDKVVWVCHHVGYGVDWLTIEESKDYTFFYGDMKNQSAPAIMLNRRYNPNASKDGFPIQQVGRVEDIEDVLDYELADPGFVSVDVKMSHDGTNLYVTVEGEKLALLDDFCDLPRLSVFVIESNIETRYQIGAGEDFLHENALRQVLSDRWGDIIAWNGNQYKMTYNVPLDETWVTENLQVVAFVHNHDAEDIFNCIVFNSEETKIGEFSGVENIGIDSEIAEIKYFNMQGIEFDTTPAEDGIYLKQVKYRNGKTEKSKIIINH